MDALDRYNLHWIVRRRHYFDGAKPFLKRFVAARCGAVVMVARDDGDAAYYLGDDYPFYVQSLDPTALEADWLRVASAFGGLDWRMASAIMRQVAARSTDEVTCEQFRAMIETITGGRGIPMPDSLVARRRRRYRSASGRWTRLTMRRFDDASTRAT